MEGHLRENLLLALKVELRRGPSSDLSNLQVIAEAGGLNFEELLKEAKVDLEEDQVGLEAEEESPLEAPLTSPTSKESSKAPEELPRGEVS